MKMKAWASWLVVLSVVAFSGVALADGTEQDAPKRAVYTTRVVDIVGRRATPIAAIEVTRALPSFQLHEMQTAFALRIEAGVTRAPF
jgi:hypothetical protein